MSREQDIINSHPLDKYIDEASTNKTDIINKTKQFSQEDQKKIDQIKWRDKTNG